VAKAEIECLHITSEDYMMDILDKWLVNDVVKIMSFVGMIIAIAAVAAVIQFFRPPLGFTDALVILAVGMIIGTFYIKAGERLSDYFEKTSRPEQQTSTEKLEANASNSQEHA
jgi:ABC-type transport system involved in cytochrome bd biosynthesis fused ATPase/permease subunit